MQKEVLMPGKGILGSGKAIIPPDKGILMQHNGKSLCEAYKRKSNTNILMGTVQVYNIAKHPRSNLYPDYNAHGRPR